MEAVSWSLVGAVSAVASDAEAEIANVVERVSMALALALNLRIDALRRWNDEPQRTRRDLLDACDEGRLLARADRLQDALIHSVGGEAGEREAHEQRSRSHRAWRAESESGGAKAAP
jgi:hypothetical protein